MTESDQFRHDRSRYERPTYKYRCGRAAAWGKPCGLGPNADGTCGGTSECAPAKIGDRFECRRPASAGGPCAEGPNPDGSCSHHHPPCKPRRTLRSVRGFLSVLALGLVVALIAALLTLGGDGAARLVPLNPGPLTGAHANFTRADGCAACHAPHDKSAGEWFLAAFHDNDITDNCLTCHTFGGPPRAAHNTVFPDRTDLGELACVQCHTEHKGEEADIVTLSDAQCRTCHRASAKSFAKGHPAFRETFPHFRRNSVQFDHGTHFGKHFVDQRFAERAPESCTSCHAVATAERTVEPRGFEETCASCHADQIGDREMVLLGLPEMVESMIDAEDLREACGPTLAAYEALQERMEALADGEEIEQEEEEFEAVSVEEATAVSAFLLGVAPDDPDEYNEPMRDLIVGLAEDGPDPLAERIDEVAGDEVSGRLLAGLSPEVVKRVACAWAANQEFEPPSEAAFGGWYGDYVELKYRPAGHADPVIRGWIEFAIAAVAEAEDEETRDLALAMRDMLIDRREGPGACVKCHAVSAAGTADDEDDERLIVEWTFGDEDHSPFVTYSHGAHLTLLNAAGVSLMDPDRGCRTCHKLNSEADYGSAFDSRDPHHFQSNFLAINRETCAECHGQGRVRQDCQLCHDFHLDPAFKLRTASDDE